MIIFIVIIFALIISCEDKKDDPHELVGTWEWQKSTYYSPTFASPDTTWIVESSSDDGLTIQFKDNDDFEMSMTGIFELTVDGTWDVSGSTVTIAIWGESNEMEYAITGDDLIWTYFEEGDPDFDEPDAWVVEEYTK